MWIIRRAASALVVLTFGGLVTVILSFVRRADIGPQHLVFFYLLPIALIATLYGSLAAMLSTLATILFAAYFLCEPLHSFQVASTLEIGELVCFGGLALIGAKCAADLMRPLLIFPKDNAGCRRATKPPATI